MVQKVWLIQAMNFWRLLSIYGYRQQDCFKSYYFKPSVPVYCFSWPHINAYGLHTWSYESYDNFVLLLLLCYAYLLTEYRLLSIIFAWDLQYYWIQIMLKVIVSKTFLGLNKWNSGREWGRWRRYWWRWIRGSGDVHVHGSHFWRVVYILWFKAHPGVKEITYLKFPLINLAFHKDISDANNPSNGEFCWIWAHGMLGWAFLSCCRLLA